MAIAGTSPKLRDPFDFHVYIGFSPKTDAIIKRLTHAWNLLCCFRYRAQITDMSKEKAERKQLIARSEKCVLYVTPEYLREPWAKAEVTAAVKKARRFSSGMLLVLKDPRISEESLRDLDLHEFPAIDWVSAPVDNDDTLPSQLASWLYENAELAPITQMPKKISGRYQALAYYFAFLNHVLKDQRQSMKRMIVDSGTNVVLPMLIVVPESCRAPKTFDVEGKIITSTKYVVSASHRGGTKNRDYKRSVIELIDSETNDVIYFSGEFPAILLTLYETSKSEQAGLSKDHLDQIRDDFCTTLQSLLCHPDNRHCIDQYRLVLWPDHTVSLYDFLLPKVRSFAEEGDSSWLVVHGTRGAGNQLLDSSFTRLESTKDLRRLWDGSPPYMMRDDVSPRGICLFIICDAVPTAVSDVSVLRHLFSKEFDFEVRIHSGQMTSDQLDSLLCDVAQEDHSRYDAFVCCVTSRGRLGTVCTSDGTRISVITLAHIFNSENCQTLSGKPKLFLIQTTDDGITEDLVSDHTSLQSQRSVWLWSTAEQALPHDAMSSPAVDDGETLVPTVADLLISYACLPTSAADKSADEPSTHYVTALTDQLLFEREVDVKEALNRVNQHCRDHFSYAKVVSTLNRPLVLPRRR